MIALSTPAGGLRNLPRAAAQVLCPVPIGRLAKREHSQPLSVAKIGRYQAGSRPRAQNPWTRIHGPGSLDKTALLCPSGRRSDARAQPSSNPVVASRPKPAQARTGVHAGQTASRRHLCIVAIRTGRFFLLAPFLRPFDVLTPSLTAWLRLCWRNLCRGVFLPR